MNASPKVATEAAQEKPDKPVAPTPPAKGAEGQGVAAVGPGVPAILKEAGKPEIVRPKLAAPPPPHIAPPAPKSRFRIRHFMVFFSFFLMVLVPGAVSAWYLWTRAADQYASYVGFSVRTEEQSSTFASLLGGLQLGGGSTAKDVEVLYQFIQSQDLAHRIDQQLDLRSIWSRADPAVDPIFTFHPPGKIEDLLEHWERKVKVIYDSGGGLIKLQVLAFTPEDAYRIAEAIFAESTKMINELSDIAREDAIRYARDELDAAVERLKVARSALTEFRNRTQIVDPTIDLQGQAALLNTLNTQLAEALIELDLLRETTRVGDPRIEQGERRVRVIQVRVEDEKRKLGIVDAAGKTEAFATLLGEYERLLVDREFAEQSYTAALATYNSAQAEARRQTRYLAAHVRPTLAEKSEYPKRLTLFGLMMLFTFLIWSITVLVAYSLRDRR